MASRYGHAWVSNYGAEPAGIAGAEWRSTLAGLGQAAIENGFRVDRARAGEWPPSSTAFRAMCLGIPSLAAVQRDVTGYLRRGGQDGVPPAPFLRLVWQHLDMFRLRHADSDKADRLIRDAYEIAREAVMRGEPLPEPPAAVIDAPRAEKPRPADPAVAAAELAKMREALGMQEPPA